jgi:excisionase family DNA binding protein
MAARENTREGTPPAFENLLSYEKAAEWLGGSVSPFTLRSWVQQGKLTKYKLGRRVLLDRNELAALVQTGARVAK